MINEHKTADFDSILECARRRGTAEVNGKYICKFFSGVRPGIIDNPACLSHSFLRLDVSVEKSGEVLGEGQLMLHMHIDLKSECVSLLVGHSLVNAVEIQILG